VCSYSVYHANRAAKVRISDQRCYTSSAKKHIRRQLARLNINRASLFPGLDGISDYIKNFLKQYFEEE